MRKLKNSQGPICGNKCSSKSELINFPQPISIWGFPYGSDGKESTCQCRRQGLDSWVGKIPWRSEWLPIPVFLPGEFQGKCSFTKY